MRTALLAGVVLALAGPAAAAIPPKAGLRAPPPPLVPRELSSLRPHAHALLQLERRHEPATERSLRRAGGQLLSRRLRIWRLPSEAAERLVPRLAVAGELREVEADRPVAFHGHLEGGDPLLPRQWWLSRIGADRAEPPGPGVPVTIIDSGLDASHPEFAGRLDTSLLNEQSVLGRREFHGTGVASLVAAPANGVGLVGVYPRAVIRAWDASPNGRLTSGDVIAGIGRAAELGPGVINLSIGGPNRDALEEEAVLDAFDRGLVIVAAAGNDREDGSPNTFPANLPHVLTVGATGPGDAVAAFSTESAGVDVAAPGEGIPIAVPVSYSPTGFSAASGTSFAAPIAAGATAWVWTARPELDKTQIIEVMRRSARDLGVPGRDRDTGIGLLDIPTALAAPAPASDPHEPNDDIAQVRAGGIFERAKPPLTTPALGRASLDARLDLAEDPEDIYRAWIPARRSLLVRVRGDRDVDLQLWRAETTTVQTRSSAIRRKDLLRESARPGSGNETVRFANRGRRGVWVYVDVFLRANGRATEANYTLDLQTQSA